VETGDEVGSAEEEPTQRSECKAQLVIYNRLTKKNQNVLTAAENSPYREEVDIYPAGAIKRYNGFCNKGGGQH